MMASALKRNVGPVTVSSSAAVVSGLPTMRVGEAERALVHRAARRNADVPQMPSRPGSSCKLDCAPGASTSTVRGENANCFSTVVATRPLRKTSELAIARR